MRAYALVVYQLKRFVQDPVPLLLLLLAPVVLVAFLLYGLEPLWEEEGYMERFDVALVDHDDSLETRTLLRQLESADDLQKVVHFDRVDEDEGRRLLQENEVGAVLIIPPDFADSLRQGKNTPLEVVGNSHRPLQASLFTSMIEAGTGLVTGAQSAVNTVYHYLRKAQVEQGVLQTTVQQAIMDYSLQSLGRQKVFAGETVSALSGFTPLEYYAVMGGCLLLMLTALLGLTQFDLVQKKGLRKRLQTLGVRPVSLVSADLLLFMIILLIQSVLILGLGTLFLDFSVTESMVWLAVMFTVSILALGAACSLLLSLPVSAGMQTLLGIILVVFMTFAGGAIVPLSYLPEYVHILSQFTLTKWMGSGLLHALFTGNKEEVIHSSVVLTGSAFGMLILAGLFRHLRMK